MKLDREQADIVMTALQNHRAELYIDCSQSEKMEKVSKIILTIEEEMEAKRLDQQKIMINDALQLLPRCNKQQELQKSKLQ